MDMKPKEKALSLWWEFYHKIEHTLSDEYSIHENFITKQCALIVVDEILEAIDWHNFEVPNDEIWYWQEVKQEIEKL